MSSSRSSSSSSSASDPALLTQYVLGLEALAAGLDPDIGLFFGTDGHGDVELYLPPEVPESGVPASVTDKLLGFDAPHHWTALAVSAGATVRSLDDPSRSVAARLTFAIDRGGRLASQLTAAPGANLADVGQWSERHNVESDATENANGDSHMSRHLREADTAQPGQVDGFLVALVRRVMGLPNRPPTSNILDWWNARWLVAILEFVDHRQQQATRTGMAPQRHQLSDLLVLHPGINRPIEAHERPSDLLDGARQAAVATDWDEQRQLAATEVQDWISPELAAWCDNTVFAYLAARDWPEPAWTLNILAHFLDEPLRQEIAVLARR